MDNGEGNGDNVDEKRLMLNVVSVRGRRWGRMRLTFTNSRNIALTHTHTHTHTHTARLLKSLSSSLLLHPHEHAHRCVDAPGTPSLTSSPAPPVQCIERRRLDFRISPGPELFYHTACVCMCVCVCVCVCARARARERVCVFM